MTLDRQAIERTDFPISRRGYDPAAVDAHLRAIAVEFEQLQRAAAGGGADLSLASTAGTHVQGILQAAETAAADIERQATEASRQMRETAAREAEATREEAIEKARAHVAAVSQATAALLERVGGMDGEVRALIDSLRAGAGRLAGDLAAVEGSMSELYDASSGAAQAAEAPREEPAPSLFDTELAGAMAQTAEPLPAPPIQAAVPAAAEPVAAPAAAAAPEASGELDSARLVALNMALNGETRADTDRYLAENFQLADRGRLVDEVYAAVEG